MDSTRREFLQGMLISLGLAMAPIPALAKKAAKSAEIYFVGLSYPIEPGDPISWRGEQVGFISGVAPKPDGFVATAEVWGQAVEEFKRGAVDDFSVGFSLPDDIGGQLKQGYDPVFSAPAETWAALAELKVETS